MTAPTAPAPDLVVAHGTLCRRAGPGKGCEIVRWSRCRACGWHGEAWDGDQPPLTDGAHLCDPAAVERHHHTRRDDG